MLHYIYKVCMVKVRIYKIDKIYENIFLSYSDMHKWGVLSCVSIEKYFAGGDFLSYCAYCLHLCLDYR